MQKPVIASILKQCGRLLYNKSKYDNLKILVHLHLFYTEQLDFFISKLKNIQGCNWNLIVTVTNENTSVTEKIKAFKPDSKIILVDNVGYDVYPFMHVIKQINLEEYDYILKLHTKRNLKDRDKILKPFIWTKYDFLKSLNKFKKNENLGLLGHKIKKIYGDSIEENEKLKLFLNELNIPYMVYNHYIPGTMFIVRSCILKSLQQHSLNKEDFFSPEAMHTGGYGSLAHVLERVFGIITEFQGYKIEDNKNIFVRLLNKIAASRNSASQKYIKIFGVEFIINKNDG